MIRIDNLSHRYGGGVESLRDVNLEVGPGEIVAIIGPSGAGKTTLLRCVSRLVRPTSGRVYVCGEDILAASGRKLRNIRRNIGVIFQQLNLVGRNSVMKNVLAGRLGYTQWWRSLLLNDRFAFGLVDRMLAFECLKKVDMGEFAQERAENLSGGQQQRVAIARVLIQAPDVILADEPIANLDPRLAHEILEILRRITLSKRNAMLISIHNIEFARKYSTRIVALREGAVLFEGLPSDLTSNMAAKIYGLKDGEGLRI